MNDDFEQWEQECAAGWMIDEVGQCLCRGVDLCGSAYCTEHGDGWEARHARGEV